MKLSIKIHYSIAISVAMGGVMPKAFHEQMMNNEGRMARYKTIIRSLF